MKNLQTFNEFANESYTEELNEGTSIENKFVKELWKELKGEQDVSKKRVEEYVHSELNSGDNQEPSVEYFWEWWSAQESAQESEINEAEINFKPLEDATYSIVFNDPVAAYKKLVKKQGGVPFDNIGFVFPKMSRETWMFIKDNFTSKDVGDIGLYDEK